GLSVMTTTTEPRGNVVSGIDTTGTPTFIAQAKAKPAKPAKKQAQIQQAQAAGATHIFDEKSGLQSVANQAPSKDFMEGLESRLANLEDSHLPERAQKLEHILSSMLNHEFRSAPEA